MNKTLKKVIALILSLIMLMSVFAVGFSVFAEDSTEPSDEPAYRSLTSVIIDFFKEIYSFFKYIFYDVFLGKDAPPIPDAPVAA